MANPLVSVVVVNWNGLEDTKLCLAHVRAQTYDNVEIIVVDNGSTDGSVDYLRTVDDIILAENPTNQGFTGGHIAGYKVSKGAYILLLNNDAVMEDHYVERAVDIMQVDNAIGVVGGRAYLWDDDNPLLNTTNNFYAYQNINAITAEGIFTQVDEGVLREVNTVSGSCVMVRRSVIEAVGYLHDPFFAYYEEADLFARIKRAGHKVMYSPDLSIWHANGKSARRKAPTFSYYMMMRNRFRFAVRNFDSWSLRRFIKFYIKMGIASSIKSFLPGPAYSMDRAYAKAFWRNCLFGWIAFIERHTLSRQLGAHVNYNQIIRREQTSVSVLVACASIQEIKAAQEIAQILQPWDEVLVIIQKPSLIAFARKLCDIDTSPLRLCIDRAYFDVPPQNLGAASAKGQWFLLSSSSDATNETYAASLGAVLYTAEKASKQVIAPCLDDIKDTARNSPVLISAQFFRDAGGLQQRNNFIESLEIMLSAAHLDGSLFSTSLSPTKRTLSITSSPKTTFMPEMLKSLQLIRDARNTRIRSGRIRKYIDRHYRIQQLLFFSAWFFSPRISVRLKVARIKNVLVGIARLRRSQVATELKHIRNEILRNRVTVIDPEKQKRAEKQKLEYLIDHPEQSTVFIITRDRFSSLRQLLDWLEEQGLNRIVFIDNNSALPPLMDYLRSTKYQVIETATNVGHTVPWTSGIIKLLLPDDFYIVTDPDVVPVMHSLDTIKQLYKVHSAYPNHLKVGLGLNINDLPGGYKLRKEVVTWENQFWQHALEPGVYEAGVDTTFAVYKPYTYWYFLHPSLRTGEPYTARHLPWYNDSGKLSDEDVFYRLRVDQSVNSWDAEQLPERYIKELDKHH